MREALTAEDPTNADYRRLLSIAYQNEGDFRAHKGDVAGALESFGKKIAIDDQLVRADPANVRASIDYSYSCERIGMLLASTGKFADATGYFRQNVTARENLVGRDQQKISTRYQLILAQAELAHAQAETGDTAPAIASAHARRASRRTGGRSTERLR